MGDLALSGLHLARLLGGQGFGVGAKVFDSIHHIYSKRMCYPQSQHGLPFLYLEFEPIVGA